VSIQARLLTYFGMVAAMSAGGFVVLWLYGLPIMGIEGLYSQEYRRSISVVESLADKEREGFESWLGGRRDELRLLGQNESFSASVRGLRSIQGPKSFAQRELLARQLAAIKDVNPGSYNYLYVNDLKTGELLAASEPEWGLGPVEHAALLDEAARSNMTQLSSVISEAYGPSIVIANKIFGFDEDGSREGEQQAVLVASVSVAASLRRDASSIRQVLGETGAALIVDANGGILYKTAVAGNRLNLDYVVKASTPGTPATMLLSPPDKDGVLADAEGEVIAVFRPLNTGGAAGLTLAMIRGTNEALALIRSNFIKMAGLGALVFMLSMALIVFAARRITAAEAQIRALNVHLEDRVEERTHELELANDNLVATLDNLESARDELVRREKLASLGALVAGVAHELNTPIGNAVLVASSLSDAAEGLKNAAATGLSRKALTAYIDDTLRGFAMLNMSLHRAGELIIGFKQLAVDRSSDKRREFSPAEIMDEVLLAVGPALKHTAHHIEVDISRAIRMDGPPGPLSQILVNLINNSLLHGFEGIKSGIIRVHVVPVSDDGLMLTFSDNGVGMSPDVVRHVFDPFFSTKFGHGGSGIGMHIVYSLVTNAFGGKIDVESTPGGGTTWRLALPLVAPVPAER